MATLDMRKRRLAGAVRILIVQKRFHMNSAGIVKGLQDRGHEVAMVVHEVGSRRQWPHLTPIVVPYGWMSVRLLGEARARRFGLPRMWTLIRTVRRLRPDVVLVKKARLPTTITGMVAAAFGALRVQLTNDAPAAGPPSTFRDRLRSLITPRLQLYTGTAVRATAPGSRWLPYPVEPITGARTTPTDDRVRVLCIGSYTNPRKRLDWVVRATALAGLEDTVTLTFVGAGGLDSDGADAIRRAERQHGMAPSHLLTNLPFSEV